MFCCSRPTQHILVKICTSSRRMDPDFNASPMTSSLGPYPHASGPVSRVVTPAETKGAKSATAAAPDVRSVAGSPRWPPESCQHPLMICDGTTEENLRGEDALGTLGRSEANAAEGATGNARGIPRPDSEGFATVAAAAAAAETRTTGTGSSASRRRRRRGRGGRYRRASRGGEKGGSHKSSRRGTRSVPEESSPRRYIRQPCGTLRRGTRADDDSDARGAGRDARGRPGRGRDAPASTNDVDEASAGGDIAVGVEASRASRARLGRRVESSGRRRPVRARGLYAAGAVAGVPSPRTTRETRSVT